MDNLRSYIDAVCVENILLVHGYCRYNRKYAIPECIKQYMVLFVVENLRVTDDKQISLKDAKKYCNKYGLDHIEVCAKSGYKVNKVFEMIGAKMIECQLKHPYKRKKGYLDLPCTSV